jgi:hypothetical protein
MHYQWLSQAYIIFTLYCISYILYPISYTQKISKFQNFPKFHNISFHNLKKFLNLKFVHKIHVLSKAWLKYMIYNEHYMWKSVSHAVSTVDLYHPSGWRPLGWYRVLGVILWRRSICPWMADIMVSSYGDGAYVPEWHT